MQFVGVIFGCIIGGAMADFFGRRLSLGFSLTSYGTSAALVGIFTSNEALSFVYVVNGLSWGILFTMYIFVVWSDLANKDNCAKMYSIGLTTYYITIGIGLLTQISIPIVFSSLATCLLVFLSNIPIMLAPELLPPYFRERMKMKLHMKAVKKIGKQSKN
jgi:MFS family permease